MLLIAGFGVADGVVANVDIGVVCESRLCGIELP